MRIYQLTSPSLGDAWGTLNLCLQVALELGEPVAVSAWWHYEGARYDVADRLRDFMLLLPLEGKVLFTTEHANQPPFSYGEALQSHRFPAKETWRPGYSRVVCHQFDCRSNALLATPTPEQAENFFRRLREHGLEPVDLGQGRDLIECVHLLATCHAFVGLSSGMSQVAMSVGAPLHVVRNRCPPDDFYGIFDRRQGRAYRTLDDLNLSSLENVGVIRWEDRLNSGA